MTGKQPPSVRRKPVSDNELTERLLVMAALDLCAAAIDYTWTDQDATKLGEAAIRYAEALADAEALPDEANA